MCPNGSLSVLEHLNYHKDSQETQKTFSLSNSYTVASEYYYFTWRSGCSNPQFTLWVNDVKITGNHFNLVDSWLKLLLIYARLADSV